MPHPAVKAILAAEKYCLMNGDRMALTDAGMWLAEHGPHKRSISQRNDASTDRTDYMREVRKRPETKKEFVERVRSEKTAECIFVPDSVRGQVAKVVFCGKTIAAARYMALLTFGTPKQSGAVVRHMCGNGHLSCVNPAHLEWGSEADNRADANKHRGCETEQDKVHAVDGRK